MRETTFNQLIRLQLITSRGCACSGVASVEIAVGIVLPNCLSNVFNKRELKMTMRFLLATRNVEKIRATLILNLTTYLNLKQMRDNPSNLEHPARLVST